MMICLDALLSGWSLIAAAKAEDGPHGSESVNGSSQQDRLHAGTKMNERGKRGTPNKLI